MSENQKADGASAPVNVNVNISSGIGWIIAVIGWIAGIVLAHGFWLTTLALIFPPYGWYLFVERAMRVAGMLAVS